MKYYIVSIAIIGSLLVSCKKHELIKEVPDNIIRTQIDSTIYPTIVGQFPESENITSPYSFLFSDTVRKNIVMTKESEVYVTFISEGAGYRNTLGWYSYTIGNEPKSSKDFKWEIVFPNISGKNEGGQLVRGDMVQLGTTKFPAGTVIGFFLIIDGWQNGSIDYNKPVYFSNASLNPNNDQHTILFKEKKSNTIILGFEDMDFSDPNCDKDYNDILISISDNKDGYEAISFDLSKVSNL